MEEQQSAPKFERRHHLTYYECDEMGHPILSMVMSIMSEVADIQSEKLGITKDTIQATGGTWVIASFSGNVDLQELEIGDEVIVGTQATGYNAFFATRDFWLRSVDGTKEYARVKSLLVFMNLTTRRIEKIPEALIKAYGTPKLTKVPRGKRPAKMDSTKEVEGKEYHVRYFDLDANHHVNNARYFDWLLDPLGEQFLTTHQLTSFSIQYRHEVRAGQNINSRFQVIDGLTSRHQITSDDELCTSAEFCWQPLKPLN